MTKVSSEQNRRQLIALAMERARLACGACRRLGATRRAASAKSPKNKLSALSSCVAMRLFPRRQRIDESLQPGEAAALLPFGVEDGAHALDAVLEVAVDDDVLEFLVMTDLVARLAEAAGELVLAVLRAVVQPVLELAPARRQQENRHDILARRRRERAVALPVDV